MEMIDIMKQRLPEGLEIIKVYNRTGNSQLRILFSYGGQEYTSYLNKTCTPGHAEENCDFTICAVMLNYALERNDLVEAKYWLDKQNALTNLI